MLIDETMCLLWYNIRCPRSGKRLALIALVHHPVWTRMHALAACAPLKPLNATMKMTTILCGELVNVAYNRNQTLPYGELTEEAANGRLFIMCVGGRETRARAELLNMVT